MFCLRVCVSLETSGLRNRSTFGILCASGWEGEREGAKRGEDTQGGLSLYVTLRPYGRQMCVWVKWRGVAQGKCVLVRVHTRVHLHTRASVCTSLFDLLHGFYPVGVCVRGGGGGVGVGGGRGPTGDVDGPPLPQPGCLGRAWIFHWGSPSCLCVRHWLTIPMYI